MTDTRNTKKPALDEEDSDMPSSNSDLQSWYEWYMNEPDGIKIRNSMATLSLDSDLYQQQVLQQLKHVQVVEGHCTVCRLMFDNWPVLHDREPPESDSEDLAGESTILKGDGRPSDDSRRWIEPVWGDVAVLDAPPDTVALEAGTRKHCLSCAFIQQCILEEDLLSAFRVAEQRLNLLEKRSTLSVVVVKWGSESHILRLSFPGKRCGYVNSGKEQLVNFFSHRDPSDVTKAVRVAFPVSVETSLSLIQEWTAKCLDSHRDCNQYLPSDSPSRLLYIAKDPIQLKHTDRMQEVPRYATLSYCWGNSRGPRLLIDNISKFGEAIEEKTLTKTFKDAIFIARAANLEYLWIDSLCIIQDSSKDWEVEAAKMAAVYGGSSLSISAYSAKSGDEGCFTRPPNFAVNFQVELKHYNGTTEVHNFLFGHPYEDVVTRSHLAGRGWAVQEKILAPRTVHCGDRGLFWECRTSMGSDTIPTWIPFADAKPLVMLDASNKEMKGLDLEGRWHDIREWYSSCNLTFPSDKPFAVSGIAYATAQESGDTYLAGLWRRNMENELCWCVETPKPRPTRYHAPSWSWIAVEGQVKSYSYWEREDTWMYVHVADVEVTLAGHDPFGAVSFGRVSLRCSGLLTGSFVPRSEARGAPPGEDDPEETVSRPRHTFIDLGHQERDFPFQLDCDEQFDSRWGSTVDFLPMHGGCAGSRHRARGGAWVKHFYIFGIVLQAIGADQSHRRRIGSFSLRSEGYQLTDYYHPFLELLDKRGAEDGRKAAAEILDVDDGSSERFLVHII